MARQALPAEVGRRRPAQLHVGIMTRDTAQATIALDRAPAHLHLFWVTKRFDDIRVQGYGSSKMATTFPSGVPGRKSMYVSCRAAGHAHLRQNGIGCTRRRGRVAEGGRD